MGPLEAVTVYPPAPVSSSKPREKYPVQTALSGELIDSLARRVSALVGGTLSKHPGIRTVSNSEATQLSHIEFPTQLSHTELALFLSILGTDIFLTTGMPRLRAVTSASSQEKGQKVQHSAQEALREMMGELGIVEEDMMGCDSACSKGAANAQKIESKNSLKDSAPKSIEHRIDIVE
jgi:hypothetical protein